MSLVPCSVSGCSNISEPKGSWCFECSNFDRFLTQAQGRADALFQAWLEEPFTPPNSATLVKLVVDLDVMLYTWRRKSHQ